MDLAPNLKKLIMGVFIVLILYVPCYSYNMMPQKYSYIYKYAKFSKSYLFLPSKTWVTFSDSDLLIWNSKIYFHENTLTNPTSALKPFCVIIRALKFHEKIGYVICADLLWRLIGSSWPTFMHSHIDFFLRIYTS